MRTPSRESALGDRIAARLPRPRRNPAPDRRLQKIYDGIRGELEIVEKRLFDMSRSGNEDISTAVRRLLSSGGKRMRPALLILASKASDGSDSAVERRVRLAVAVELMHTASLIHDDVLDKAEVRRSLPTINARWGNRTAVLVGDHIYSKVIGILAEDGDTDVMRCVASTACAMTESEMIQSVCRNDTDMTEEKYLSIIRGKTAALMSCSCRVGAMLGNVRDGEPDILGDYGLNLGMAFQITDDLLDIVGNEARLGKRLSQDIRGGSLTLPFIYAVSHAAARDRNRIVRGFTADGIDAAGLARIGELVRESGGVEYCLGKAWDYCRACRKNLKMLKKSGSRDTLASLADYVASRINAP